LFDHALAIDGRTRSDKQLFSLKLKAEDGRQLLQDMARRHPGGKFRPPDVADRLGMAKRNCRMRWTSSRRVRQGC
jgi:hypothetical protein